MLTALAPETLNLIFKLLKSKADIIALRKTCKFLLHVGQEALFHTVEISDEKNKLESLIELITEQPHIARFIRSLVIFDITEDDSFLQILKEASGLKVLTLRYSTEEDYALPLELIQHICSDSITSVLLTINIIGFEFIHNIIHHLPVLFYLGLRTEKYNINNISKVSSYSSHPHNSLRVFHIICTSKHMTKIISAMILVPAINWSAIQQLIITQPVTHIKQEFLLYTFHPKLVALLSNVIYLHLSLTRKPPSDKNYISYGVYEHFFKYLRIVQQLFRCVTTFEASEKDCSSGYT